MADKAFLPNLSGLSHALALLEKYWKRSNNLNPNQIFTELQKVPLIPTKGRGEIETLETLAPLVIGGARKLHDERACAHMDPPTPWIAWAVDLWKAALNQNLLHKDVAPVATQIESRLISELAPLFGQSGGHFTSGSTVANLSALWAAREITGAHTVVTSNLAHISVAKAAHILGLKVDILKSDEQGKIQISDPDQLSHKIVVYTAGTTLTGAIDPLMRIGSPAWIHVDAAWAGPLRLTNIYSHVLNGIEIADSLAISAHKWLFQPKDSAIVLFKDVEKAHRVMSIDGPYLKSSNIGVVGSRSANAVTLAATLMAMGRDGISARIEHCLLQAQLFADKLIEDGRFEILEKPHTGILLWRTKAELEKEYLPLIYPAFVSTAQWKNQLWLRSVAANPNFDHAMLYEHIVKALENL